MYVAGSCGLFKTHKKELYLDMKKIIILKHIGLCRVSIHVVFVKKTRWQEEQKRGGKEIWAVMEFWRRGAQRGSTRVTEEWEKETRND